MQASLPSVNQHAAGSPSSQDARIQANMPNGQLKNSLNLSSCVDEEILLHGRYR